MTAVLPAESNADSLRRRMRRHGGFTIDAIVSADGGAMDFSLANGEDTGLLVLLEDI